MADSRAEKKGQQREPVRRQTETGNRHPTVVTCRSPFTSSLHLSPLLTLVPRNGVKRMRGECNETNRRWTKWTRMERTSERQEASNDRGSLRPSFCRIMSYRSAWSASWSVILCSSLSHTVHLVVILPPILTAWTRDEWVTWGWEGYGNDKVIRDARERG